MHLVWIRSGGRLGLTVNWWRIWLRFVLFEAGVGGAFSYTVYLFLLS